VTNFKLGTSVEHAMNW